MNLTIEQIRTQEALVAARQIRQVVFVEEQGCPPEEEWDDYEDVSRHFLGTVDGLPVAAARWREVLMDGKPVAKLERFAVLKEHRGNGVGKRMVRHVMKDALNAGFSSLVLHAQTHLTDFYISFGFEPMGDVFWEAGIAHIEMVRQGDGLNRSS